MPCQGDLYVLGILDTTLQQGSSKSVVDTKEKELLADGTVAAANQIHTVSGNFPTPVPAPISESGSSLILPPADQSLNHQDPSRITRHDDGTGNQHSDHLEGLNVETNICQADSEPGKHGRTSSRHQHLTLANGTGGDKSTPRTISKDPKEPGSLSLNHHQMEDQTTEALPVIVTATHGIHTDSQAWQHLSNSEMANQRRTEVPEANATMREGNRARDCPSLPHYCRLTSSELAKGQVSCKGYHRPSERYSSESNANGRP